MIIRWFLPRVVFHAEFVTKWSEKTIEMAKK